MKKKDKKKKDGITSIIPGTLIIIAAMILVFGAVFAWMYSMDLLFLPDFIKNIFGLGDKDEAVVWDMGELQSAVRDGRDSDGKTVTYDITFANLKKAFLESETPKGEFVDAEIRYYADDEPDVQRVCLYRNGSDLRSELYSFGTGDKLETVFIRNGKTVNRINKITGETVTSPAINEISFENETGVPSVDELIARVKAFPDEQVAELETDAETSAETDIAEQSLSDDGELPEVIDCDIKLLRTENGNVYYITYTYTEQGLKEEYYISLDYRVIIFMQSSMDGKPVYVYEVKSVSHDPDRYAPPALYKVS